MTASVVAPDVRSVVAALERRIRGYGDRVVVAFSGGVDSSVVLAIASRALSPAAVTAVTALSPSLPAGELDAAARVAADLGVEHRTVTTRELDREAYARNDDMRCFHCKAELYATLGRIAASAGRAIVLAGANADDLSDFRPGLWAGARAGIRNPLLEEGAGKSAVRAVARALGLRVADKPALACLSSRVELGRRITPELLGRIDAAEGIVRALGFEVVRVRHRGERATIEVPVADVARLAGHPGLERALSEIRHLGWHEVAMDPLGYRRGSVGPASGGLPRVLPYGRPEDLPIPRP